MGMGDSYAPTNGQSRGVTRILVVDDHKTFADLLKVALDAEPDLHCVATGHSVGEGLLLVDSFRPDLVVMDYQLGDGDGVAATAEIVTRHPGTRVIVLTAHADSDLMRRAAEAGACCLLPKDGSLPDLLNALRSARPGGFVVHPALLKSLVVRDVVQAEYVPPLSRRENDVLRMLSLGMDARAIAEHLGISVNTCRGYVKSLLAKLGAHSQLEAVAIANRRGLIHAESSAR
jgi:DNA-binding NarL/FixJ family response regulator